jgi:hypothetical protein
MIATLLFVAFVAMLLLGVPIGAALGLAGAACIALANSSVQWFGLLAVPQNFYAGLGKYPLAGDADVRAGRLDLRPLGRGLRLVNFASPSSAAARACCRWWRSRSRCFWAASRARARPMPRPWAR